MKLIILDRDGVINKDIGTYVTKPDEFEFAEGVVDAIADFKRAGYLIGIATNQGGIGRGMYSHEDLAAIHAVMLAGIRQAGGDVDRILYCPSYDDSHPWRKPNAGMLTTLLADFNVAPKDAVFIGDAVRDMQAGFSAGCHLMLLTSKHGKMDYRQLDSELQPHVRLFSSLADAARTLITEDASCC